MAMSPEERHRAMWSTAVDQLIALAPLMPTDVVKSAGTALATIAAEREDAPAIEEDHGKTKKRKHT